MRRLGIDMQTVFGLSPLDHAKWAAEMGCTHISVGLMPVPWKLPQIPAWSLRDDPELRRATKAALQDLGISLSAVEGFVVRPKSDVKDRASELDIAAELGAERATTVVMEPDTARALDQLSTLAELSAERGMELTLEFAPPHAVNNLQSALSTIGIMGKPNVWLVIDAMHFFRSGSTVSELGSVDPALIGYLQLCDAPRASNEDYLQEACFKRKCPGEGELPLVELVQALPPNVPVGLEVPMLAEAEGDLKSTIGRIVSAARRLLERCE